MDCDYDPEATTSKESKSKRKRKRKTKFAEVLSEPKPTFNPDDKTYEEYLDEYYKLECEDIIGDIPCRFKYRKVVPNSFGLTIEEVSFYIIYIIFRIINYNFVQILAANDRELNKWCSLKKAVQYRPENVEKYDLIAFDKKGRNEALKRKILPSLFKEDEATTSGNSSNKQILGKSQEIEHVSTDNLENNSAQNDDSHSKENKKKKKQKKSNDVVINIKNKEISNETNDVKGKKKKKKAGKLKLSNTNEGAITSTIKTNENSNKKRKRKTSELKDDSNKKKFPKKDNSQKIDISDARLKAFGVKPKKFKNKMKYGQNKNNKSSK